jgi:hypothetical protein
MNNGEDTLASYPGSILMSDTTIVQRRRLIESYATTMDLFGEGYLVRVEVLPT